MIDEHEVNNDNGFRASMEAEERKSLIEAREVYSLSKIETRSFKTRRIRRAVVKGAILFFFFLGILVAVSAAAFVPPLYRSIKTTVGALEEDVAERDTTIRSLTREVDSYREREHIQKGVVFELRYQLDQHRLRNASKKEIDKIKDIDLSFDVEENYMQWRKKYSAQGQNIARGNVNYKEIALTFDLGTGRDIEFLYKALKRYGIVATVFLSNETPKEKSGALFNQRNIEYIKRLSDLGCEFGNHTWSHYDLHRALAETSYKTRLLRSECPAYPMSYDDMKEEFLSVEKKFTEITGKRLARIWRAPYGGIDQDVIDGAASIGYERHILWSADLLDYVVKGARVDYNPDRNVQTLAKDTRYYTSEEMLEELIRMGDADPLGMRGVITLCHLGSPRSEDKMIEILPRFIEHYHAKGYAFVTVTEILNDKFDKRRLPQAKRIARID